MSEKAVSLTKTVLIILGLILTGLAVYAIIREHQIITDAIDKITGRGLALWIWGFWVALVGGHFGTKWAVWIYRSRLRFPIKPPPAGLPAWMVGTTEEFIFALLIAVNGFGTGVAAVMAGWVSIKMATGWARAGDKIPSNPDYISWKATAFSSLLGNLVSMSFAVLGGSICHLAFHSPK